MARKSFASKAAPALWRGIVALFKLAYAIGAGLLEAAWAAAAWLFLLAWRSGSSAASGALSKAKEAGGPKPAFKPLREVRRIEGSLTQFEEWLHSSKSTVGIILGSRGSGKSALGLRLLENWAARGRKVSTMGFENAGLPAWIRNVRNPEETPNGSVLLVDEGGLEFSSRNTMSTANKLLSNIVFISRHKDLSILFICQNSANLEVNSIRQADYLLLKKPSLLQKDFERKKIAEIYETVAKDFGELTEDRGLVYIYSDRFRGFASNELPSFWSEKASKSFRVKKIGGE